MKKKTPLVFLLGILVGAGGASVVNRPSANSPVTTTSSVSTRPAATSKPARTAANGMAGQVSAQAGNNGGNNQNGGNGQKAPKQPADQQARASLALVGFDAAAEQYWLGAINNPDLPAGERKNLIEDLANEGLTSTKNPTPADVQLVAYRLQLISQLAEAPMDATNAKALNTAQKDLAKIATKALAQAGQQ